MYDICTKVLFSKQMIQLGKTELAYLCFLGLFHHNSYMGVGLATFVGMVSECFYQGIFLGSGNGNCRMS